MNEAGSLFYFSFLQNQTRPPFYLFSDKTINTKYRLLQIITFGPYMKNLCTLYKLCNWFILNSFYTFLAKKLVLKSVKHMKYLNFTFDVC